MKSEPKLGYWKNVYSALPPIRNPKGEDDMATCTIKELLTCDKGTKTWAPIRVEVSGKYQDWKEDNNAHGVWRRAETRVSDGTGEIKLQWTDPLAWFSGTDGVKNLHGKTLILKPGAVLDSFSGRSGAQYVLKTKGDNVQVLGAGETPLVPGGVEETARAEEAAAATAPPSTARPSGGRQVLSDRRLLGAITAWAPLLRAALAVPGSEGSGQAVAACINTMTIAATKGDLQVTMQDEAEEIPF